MRFSIVIPNYNNAEWLDKCLQSILNQTFKDYQIIVVDDCSTDNSLNILRRYEQEGKINLLSAKAYGKVFNGGARNMGISLAIGEYILFLDSDDWFNSPNCLELINKTIEENNYPDCVSLSYNCLIGGSKTYQPLIRNTIKDLVDSLYVACWTKCIKRELIQKFPENTLMEDVVQHIKQCDHIKTVVSIDTPIVCWNRNNVNSCSRVENQNLQQGKWQSSMYRYCADLMDLRCENEDCENHRKWRLEVVLNNIKEGKYIQ